MFLREVKRDNRNGTQVSYLQLVHNDWDSAARTSRTKILYSFGRTDQVDTAAIERLIVSLSRLLDPAAALRATGGSDRSFICSRPLGGTDVLDGLWRRLGIDTAMSRLLARRRVSSPFERVLFGLVANRALAPSSKLAAADWISNDVHIDEELRYDNDERPGRQARGEPLTRPFGCGRYWDRTSDLFGVNAVPGDCRALQVSLTRR